MAVAPGLKGSAKNAVEDQYEQIRSEGVALENSTVDRDFVRETVESHDLRSGAAIKSKECVDEIGWDSQFKESVLQVLS